MVDDTCHSSSDGSPYPGDCEFTAFLRDKAAHRRPPLSQKERWQACVSKAKDIKLLLLDVDGVLTDGSITYSDTGDEIKTFNARDGFGLNILRKAGVEVGIITARQSPALERRLQDLSLSHVYQGVRHKVRAYDEIKEKLQLKPFEVAYMGDDWLDLPLLTRVGLAVTVADGVPEVQEIVDFITEKSGGRGAVREVCDLIIEAKGKKDTLLAQYCNRT